MTQWCLLLSRLSLEHVCRWFCWAWSWKLLEFRDTTVVQNRIAGVAHCRVEVKTCSMTGQNVALLGAALMRYSVCAQGSKQCCSTKTATNIIKGLRRTSDSKQGLKPVYLLWWRRLWAAWAPTTTPTSLVPLLHTHESKVKTEKFRVACRFRPGWFD